MDILRKLTPLEAVFNFYTQATQSLIFPTTFLIDSAIDLFFHHEKITESIRNWKKSHPLLCCSLKNISDEFFFVKNTDNTLDNVFFLKPTDSDAQNWLKIHRNELLHQFQIEKDPLWRLFIVELDKNQPNEAYRYSFTINLHHSISDASNNFALIVELLYIIENNLKNEPKELDQQRILCSSLELNFPNDPRFGRIHPDISLEQFIESEKGPLLPEYFQSGQRYKFKSGSNGKFTSLEGQDYATYEDLEQKIDASNSGFVIKQISDLAVKKLFEKCRAKNLKLNSIFEVVSSMAFKKVSEKFCGKSCPSGTNKYEVSINMRPFLAIPNNVMGCWISFFEGELNLDFDEMEENFWSQSFWSLCEQKCKALHDNLKKKEFMSHEVAEMAAILLHLLKNGQRFKNYVYNYAISNMGDKSNQELGTMFKIKEYYPSLSYNVDNEFGLLATCSIQLKSFWTFSYNRKLFCDEAAKLFLDSIEEYIFKASA
ncbi:hypothetical protein BpHYR1_014223 [Brachionus plicatilis]|uniref:Condensation domain-containing protein n=1 Tax=Brachionus plicatilis TaxID=10195 RepID=A0A3M7SBQ7_BRAPC|nr:hypothetical protein BpHYR1_014223 [Brachionus plicatilis]